MSEGRAERDAHGAEDAGHMPNIPAGYRCTEVGVIPQDWKSSSVRAIASSTPNAIVGGPFGSDLVSKDYVPQGVPVIRGQNMGGRWVSGDFVFVTPMKARALEANLAYPGDIVFTQRGTLGQVCLVPDNPFSAYVVSQSQMKLSVNQRIADSLYVFYFFTSYEQKKSIQERAIQTGVPHINLRILRAIPVRLPPPSEQRNIARSLSEVDGMIGSLEALIVKKRAITQATMQQLLTGRTRLPEFAGKWATGRLKNVAYLHRDHVMPSDDSHAVYEVFSLPAYDVGRCPSVEPSAAIQSGKFRVPRDAVLLSRLNPRIPRVWAPPSLKPNAIASTEFLVLTPREAADRAFLYWLCSSPQFCDQMVAAVTGTTGSHQRVNRTDAMNFPIRFPSLPEQRAIATVLADMDAEIAALERRLDKTRSIKQGMMQQLLTGAIRLPVQDDA